METSIDSGPIIVGILMIGYAIWWKIKVDLPKKKKRKKKKKKRTYLENLNIKQIILKMN